MDGRGQDGDEPLGDQIVVADPTPSGRKLAESLRQEGFRVHRVHSVPTALAAVTMVKPRLLVTEWQFDEHSGLELLLGSQQTCARTHVIVATAHGSIRAAYTAIRAGALDFLSKPVTAGQIIVSLTGDGVAPGEHSWVTLDETRRAYIRDMLAQFGSIARTARVLRLDRRSLRRIMTRLQVCKLETDASDS